MDVGGGSGIPTMDTKLCLTAVGGCADDMDGEIVGGKEAGEVEELVEMALFWSMGFLPSLLGTFWTIDIVAIVLNAMISDRSGFEPRFCHRPKEDDRKSLVTPLGLEITVDKPPSLRRTLVGPPTRTGSLSPDSLAKVRHSDVSSMEWDSRTSPHSEQTVGMLKAARRLELLTKPPLPEDWPASCWDLLRTHIFPRTRELPQFPISPKPLFLSKNRLRNPPKPILKQNKKLCTYAEKKSLHICKVFGKKKVNEALKKNAKPKERRRKCSKTKKGRNNKNRRDNE
ncbi:hypothetical protein LXL04_000358 [Taraxacum kok-saghyz]